MSKIPAKKTGCSANKLLRGRAAGFLHVVRTNGRVLYDTDALAAWPVLVEKARENLAFSGKKRKVGAPGYKDLAEVLGLGGV